MYRILLRKYELVTLWLFKYTKQSSETHSLVADCQQSSLFISFLILRGGKELQINTTFCFSAGFEFFESANGVILCPGDERGFLPKEYFKKVVDRKKGTSLLV